jgi:peroxiredoxin
MSTIKTIENRNAQILEKDRALNLEKFSASQQPNSQHGKPMSQVSVIPSAGYPLCSFASISKFNSRTKVDMTYVMIIIIFN